MASVVVRRMFYVTSGYSGNAMPGNALLGFSVDRPVASREGPSSQDLEIPLGPYRFLRRGLLSVNRV
jgi:hypothetical protein